MWTQVSADDAMGLARQVNVVRPAIPFLPEILPAIFVASIRSQQGELWYYQGEGFEVGLLLQFPRARAQWQLLHLGFNGDVQLSQVMDILVARIRDSLRDHGAASMLTVPVTTGDSPVVALYDLFRGHPYLQVRTVAQNRINSLWEVAYVGP